MSCAAEINSLFTYFEYLLLSQLSKNGVEFLNSMNIEQSFPLCIFSCCIGPSQAPYSVISPENKCYIDLFGWEVVLSSGHPFCLSLDFLIFTSTCRIPHIAASLVYAVLPCPPLNFSPTVLTSFFSMRRICLENRSDNYSGKRSWSHQGFRLPLLRPFHCIVEILFQDLLMLYAWLFWIAVSTDFVLSNLQKA